MLPEPETAASKGPVQRCVQIARGASVLVILIGLSVLAGWFLDFRALTRVLPGFVSMKPNAAVAFCCAGLSLLLFRLPARPGPGRRWRQLSIAFAATAAILGALTLWEYAGGFDLGIDELLFLDYVTSRDAQYPPGRMAPISAFNFVCLGLALVFLHFPKRTKWAHALTACAAFLSLLAIVGYFYGVASLYQTGNFTAVASHTALAFLTLCIGVWCATSNYGFMQLMTGSGTSGKLLRRLGGAALVLPFLFDWLGLRGELSGWYGPELAAAIFAVANVVTFALLVWFGAGSLRKVERTQALAQESLHQAHLELEQRVRERTEELATANNALQAENADRRQAEETLRDSEEKFRQMAENITDAFWIRSADMQEVHYLSPGFERIWGRSRECLYANPQQWTEFILPEDRERVRGAFATLLGEAASLDLEYRIVRPDGEQRWIRARGFQVRDAAGQLIRHTGIVSDITERKRAEQETKRTLQRLNEAQRIGQIGDWEWDMATQAITWSPQVFEILGRDSLLGPPRDYEEYAALYDAKNRALLKESIARTMESGVPEAHELMVFRRDGQPVYIRGMAVCRKDESGRVFGLYGTIQDITERKRGEDALRASEQRYHSLFDNMLEGYAYCRPHFEGDELRDFTYLEVNSAFAELTGLKDVTGKRVSELIPGIQESSRELFQVYSRVARTGQPEKFEVYVAALDRWFSITVYSSERESFVVVFDNITERKRAALKISSTQREIEQLNADLEKRVAQRTEALSAATAEAERANHAKSEFLSRMSHELRTPMNAILGFAQVLETEDGLTDDQRDSVGQIVRGGGHLLELINEVLDITSIESGRLTLSSEPIALAGLLTETIGLLWPLSAEFHIEIDVLARESAGVYVQADRQRLKQVLLNLLGNALKYNRPGGCVTVRYAAGGSPATTRLSVTDNGAGLDAAKLARLFHPFDRLGAEQTRVEGTGLGLVLARRMVEQMGGTLGVESVVGEGSTFWIELPTAEPPLEPEVTAADLVPVSDPEGPADSRVILYIEDNPSNVRLVTRILARRPAIRLLCAETGALGLKMAREHRPDLILLDLHLPDCHGDDVLASLAVDPRTGAIPVVMLTADAVAGTREEMLASGARGFITKPLDVRSFLGVIDRFLAVEPSGVG